MSNYEDQEKQIDSRRVQRLWMEDDNLHSVMAWRLGSIERDGTGKPIKVTLEGHGLRKVINLIWEGDTLLSWDISVSPAQ